MRRVVIFALALMMAGPAWAQNTGAAGPNSEDIAKRNAHDAAEETRGADALQSASVIQLNTPPQVQLCLAPAGLAVGTLGWAATATGWRHDPGCERRQDTAQKGAEAREDALVLEKVLHLHEAAVRRMCQIEADAAAMAAAGTPCEAVHVR